MPAPERSYVCPLLIGRSAQLEALSEARRRAQRGLLSAVVLSGEAGIGKSRLAAETLALARAEGFRVLRGDCFEGGRALPFSAVIELLRTVLAESPDEAMEPAFTAESKEFVKLLPDIASRVPEVMPSPRLDAEEERRRLFHALARFLTRTAGSQPLLLLFEDLHWSDATTLDFLQFLCSYPLSQMHGFRLLVLMTYRSDETHPALDHFLAELDRLRLAEEIPLKQLSRAETQVMVKAILGQDNALGRELLDELFNRTEGNPFFVEEVLKSLSGAAFSAAPESSAGEQLNWRAVPRTVKDAVERRADRLSADARRLLEAAAVTGYRFDLPLLQAVTASESAVLIEEIRELVDAQLVVEEAAGVFRFRHALTREALYSGLLLTDRSEYHRAVAEALESKNAGQPDEGDGRVVDLAHHFYRAGVWDKAQLYCEQAGRRAHRLFAPAACVEHLSHALEAARRIGTAQPSSLLRVRAGALELLGQFNQALADLETALVSSQRAGERDEEWEALIALGVLWLSKDYDRAGAYFQEALKLAQETGDRRRVAYSLNRVGNWQMNIGDPPGALVRHNEALSILEELDDLEGIADTLDLLGMTSYHSVKIADEISYHRKAVGLFQKLGNRPGAISSLSLLTVSSSSYDWPAPPWNDMELAAAIAGGEEALAEARAIGWRGGESFACYVLSMTLGWQGDYSRALSLANEGLQIAVEIQHEQWRVAMLRALGELEIDLLNPEGARVHLEEGLELARKTKSDFWTVCLSAGFARALVALGEAQKASGLLQPFVEDRPLMLTSWLSACAEVEVALALKDFGRVLHHCELLEVAAWPDGRPSRLTLLRVEALLGLKRVDEAVQLVERLFPAGRPLPAALQWRAALLTGRAQAALGRRAQAARAYHVARRLLDEVGAGIEDASVRRRFVDRASVFLPRTRPETEARAQAREQFDGLTERERDVAALVSTGHSNREIAEALFLSERTVAVHVANVLAKLGFVSRTQIAAWAALKGLTAADSYGSVRSN